jgi:hypothetical protein
LSGLYVYAFVAGAMKPARIAGRRIEFLDVGGLHAAVERLGNPPRLSESTLRAQHAVVARLGQRFDAIIPVRFGAFVMPDELERVVRSRRTALARGLKRVRGHVQMTTRIFATAVVNTATARSRPSSGTEYLLERKSAAAVTSSPMMEALRTAAAPFSIDERVEKGRAPGATTLFHLVARGDAGKYRTRVLQAASEVDSLVHVAVTGPWPPFAFVTELWS